MNFLNKIWEKTKVLLKQGLTPEALALSLVISTLVSIFPVFGLTTLALTCLALMLKLNLPIMFAFSYIAGILKLIVLIPFINLGSSILGAEHTLLSYEAIKASFEESFLNTARDLSFELLCGVVGWGLTAIPLGIVLYYLLKLIFIFIQEMKAKRVVN